MNDEDELSISDLRNKRGDASPVSTAGEENFSRGKNGEETFSQGRTVLNSRPIPRAPQLSFESEPGKEESMSLPFDPVRAIDAVRRRWYWWLGLGVIVGAAIFCWFYFATNSLATLQLIRRDVPMLFRASEAGEAFKPQQFAEQTLATLITSPEVFRRVSARTNWKIPAWKLGMVLFAKPEKETELVTLVYMGNDKPPLAATLLNYFAEEIVGFTKEMQAREGNEMMNFLGNKLGIIETNLAAISEEMKAIPPELKFLDADKQTEAYLVQLSDLDAKYELARIDLEASNPAAEKLQLAKEELATLLLKYTEAMPAVQDQQKKIKALEIQLASEANSPAQTGAGNSANGIRFSTNPQTRALAKQLEQIKSLRENIQKKLNGLSEKNFSYAMIKSRYQSLELMRTTLASRQREAQIYAENAIGYYQIFTHASADRVSTKVNWRKSGMMIVAGTFLTMILAAGFIMAGEILDDRIKTAADLKRVTGLPILATLGDLSSMNADAQTAWAFRAWTIVKGKISETQNHALVCGLISAKHGEGRTTWTSLLAKTAHQRGLRVLVAATRSSTEAPLHPHEKVVKPKDDALSPATKQNVFTFPFQATKQLRDPKSHSIVQIPLPGWVWNLERRQQWHCALQEWKRIDNLVFLVELPPACEPEAVLLAENLPQLIWLAESGKTTARETRTHLETLRHAGCNLVGAVLNREPASFTRKYFSRYFGTMLLALCFAGFSTRAAETNLVNQSAATVPASGASQTMRAAWQQRLTLGPGDILTLGFYGETNLTKNDVVIGMDGRVSYMQAHEILATGLTVDELREKLNSELGKYYRSPRVLITPMAYRSKKYYVLGKVMTKGVFVLDRPLTILEAVSRAHGLETGLADRNTIDMADLQRSFLIRHGQRTTIDLEKLFHEGDFAQNISIEPEDFLYFAPANLKEIYVVGEVRAPGILPYTEHSSVIRAISERGGFAEAAWKNRVLVIRGSLSHPETFIVNTWEILDARAADFKLQPRDIVYVSRRPFIRAEQLLDTAATAFIQSAMTSWSGANIGPLIKTPFVPEL